MYICEMVKREKRILSTKCSFDVGEKSPESFWLCESWLVGWCTLCCVRYHKFCLRNCRESGFMGSWRVTHQNCALNHLKSVYRDSCTHIDRDKAVCLKNLHIHPVVYVVHYSCMYVNGSYRLKNLSVNTHMSKKVFCV